MQIAKFNFKAFTSFVIFLAFFFSSVSGIVLYMTPPGRIAHWVDWRLLGLDKEQWGAVHTLFVILMLIAITFHLFYFNWKVFLAYLKKKRQPGLRLKREMISAIIVSLIFLVGTLADLPPFGTVMAVGGDIKDYWDRHSENPPAAHAEELTLRQYADQIIKADVAQLVAVLAATGVAAAPDDRIGDLGERLGTSSSGVHNILLSAFHKEPEQASTKFMGQGYGRIIFSQLCEQLEVDPVLAARSLRSQGIIIDDFGENVRRLAEKNNLTPYEMADLILKGSGT